VKHSRLKGGKSPHSFSYPIFFAYIDLEDIKSIGLNWWPLFAVNSKYFAFSSLEDSDHLKLFDSSYGCNLASKTKEFLISRLKTFEEIDSTCILTHLTYFGYCFNPVSFYYNFEKENDFEGHKKLHSVIVEVSNTPWIEQHIYILHESIDGVRINRHDTNDMKRYDSNINKSIDNKEDNEIENEEWLEARWNKEFHVSPFMEMDYTYHFIFNKPKDINITSNNCKEKKNRIIVRSKLLKNQTNDCWFTASFDVEQYSFTPIMFLYLLFYYPVHTRWIQILIHIEAIKLWLKDVPTYEHPHVSESIV
jgi:hypothetical protein